MKSLKTKEIHNPPYKITNVPIRNINPQDYISPNNKTGFLKTTQNPIKTDRKPLHDNAAGSFQNFWRREGYL